MNKYTLAGIVALGAGLTRLELIGFDTIADQSFGAVLKQLPSLRLLNLRYGLYSTYTQA